MRAGDKNEDLAPGVQAAFDIVAKVEDNLNQVYTDCRVRTDELQSRQEQDRRKFESLVNNTQVRNAAFPGGVILICY